MSERATLPELKEFANKVRAAGGGNPIDALIPAVPQDQSQCLIAKNLNFNCAVSGSSNSDGWSMYVDDEEVAERISETLGLTLLKETGHYVNIYGGEDADGLVDAYRRSMPFEIALPESIGQVAEDFDHALSTLNQIRLNKEYENDPTWDPIQVSAEQVRRAQEMVPYIEESILESHRNASIINDDGSIVV